MTALTPDEIKRLSPVERLSLIGDLWNSLDDADVPLPPAPRKELERRLAHFDEEAAHAVTWDKFNAKLATQAS
jgi:putative addiction module component (TIGR02574 family)